MGDEEIRAASLNERIEAATEQGRRRMASVAASVRALTARIALGSASDDDRRAAANLIASIPDASTRLRVQMQTTFATTDRDLPADSVETLQRDAQALHYVADQADLLVLLAQLRDAARRAGLLDE